MSNGKAQQVLAEEIVEDARKRAERTMARARAEVEKIGAQARADAEAQAEKIRTEAEQRARRKAEMIARTVDQEVARRKLRAREAVVQQALDEAKKRLDAISGDEYKRSLIRLAAAAMREMPCEEFIVRVSTRAEDNIAPAWLAAELGKALDEHGRKAVIQVELRADLPRGVLVKSGDGRLQWDNTFDTRLKRLRAGLRRRIAPGLFGET